MLRFGDHIDVTWVGAGATYLHTRHGQPPAKASQPKTLAAASSDAFSAQALSRIRTTSTDQAVPAWEKQLQPRQTQYIAPLLRCLSIVPCRVVLPNFDGSNSCDDS